MDDLSQISDDDLIDEVLSRGVLGKVDKGNLVETLSANTKTTTVNTGFSWEDYVIAVEDGAITFGTGKVTILIVED